MTCSKCRVLPEAEGSDYCENCQEIRAQERQDRIARAKRQRE
jgi:hypothetical protein